MAIPKVIGTETEYGIAAVGQPDFNPVLSSSMLISSYAGSLRRIRWDYEDESPLRDARGFEPVTGRELSDEDLGLANVILPNGARYYVDHAHPEYSTPECLSPRSLVIHDKAGERILERSLAIVAAEIPSSPALAIYKNNSDGKGNSYGTHENYLVDRATPFGDIVRDLTPFFVSRQIFTGAGKLGLEAQWDERGKHVFQLTQRADFFETEVGLETTLKRPIINTRDEPHADPERYRRLHVIVGDANLCEVALFLKLGATSIVLKMIEDAFLPDFSLVNPVAAIHDVSRDVSLTAQVALTDGRKMTALQLQWEYLELARKYVDREDDTSENREVVERWEGVLRGLESDPRTLSGQLDWVAKLRLLEGYRERDGLAWSDAKLRAIDLQYHDVRRDRGLYHRLANSGKVERLTTDEQVERAIMEPPEDTRAFFRGRCISKYPDAIAAASWDSLILDTGRDALQRIPMREPLRGTRAHVEELLDECEDAAALVDRLTG
ncbi:MAG: proteasome accessory factor PafA2 [Actinobacteria bacterium]|nr:MAG: proteasome accessory factor PafA2 [Actinomycetota bacterium]TMK21113.1 MAG: proteasome accessory factor PafA2 [Actinomycetota bacterium]TMK92947.1 MAG: proteasome accessory factor PafA2 [Actinomycetota bacterium]TMM21279.1 MAG: proteasome accessory factor PafA2 [Actinomycetota bacterium]